MNEIRFESAAATTGKMIPARLLPGTDLLEGIEAVCEKHGVKYAYVTCFGSFSHAGYMYLVPKVKCKVDAGYGDVIERGSPVEFLSGTGVVCQKEGQCDIHFHGTMCDAEGNVFGGHMVKGYNRTLTTVDVMIIECNGAQMLRGYDEETDLTQFQPR